MKRSSILNRNHGFTLVELLVSAGIIALTVFVLVGVVRKGNEISVTNVHRQKARAIMDSCFESAAYQFSNYLNIPARPGDVVVIDPRVVSNTGDDLTGTLSITVAGPFTDIPPLTGQTPAAYKRVTMTVSWMESQGLQAITLVKLITKLDL